MTTWSINTWSETRNTSIRSKFVDGTKAQARAAAQEEAQEHAGPDWVGWGVKVLVFNTASGSGRPVMTINPAAGRIIATPIRSRHGPTYKFRISGGGVHGETTQVMVGLDEITHQRIRDITLVNRDDNTGRSVPDGKLQKVYAAIRAAWTAVEADEANGLQGTPLPGGGLLGAFGGALGAKPRRGAGRAAGQTNLFAQQAPARMADNFRVKGGRCVGPGGRFAPNAACGMPPAQVREGCRDASGAFLPIPQCSGRGVGGLAGMDDIHVGSYVRLVDDYKPHWPQAQARGAWPPPIGDHGQNQSWMVGMVEDRDSHTGNLDVRWITGDGPMSGTFPTNASILTVATPEWMRLKGWGVS